MPASSLGDWIRFLATNAEVVGVVTWIGLIVTICGFVIALAQIRKIKRSSEAARDAVAKLSTAVRSQEQATKITDALGHLRMAQAMVRRGNAEAAAAYLAVSWSMLTYAREMGVGLAERDQIERSIVNTKKLRDDLVTSTSRATPSAF